MASLLPAEVQGQVDSLEEVADTVTGVEAVISVAVYHLTEYTNTKHLPLDKKELNLQFGSNLAELLSDNGSARFNNYGPALNTLSIEGLGSQRSSFQWEGADLNSPSLGTIDWSLIPSFFLPEQTPAQSVYFATYHNGEVLPNEERRLYLGYGSFKDRRLGLDFRRFEETTLTGQAAVWFQQADNDFPYADERMRRASLPNAGTLQFSAKLMRELPISQNASLKASVWTTYAERELPPTVGQSDSRANQMDQQHRFNLRYLSNPDSLLGCQIRLTHLDETLNYQDPSQSIDSPTSTRSSSLDFVLWPKAKNYLPETASAESSWVRSITGKITTRAASPAGVTIQEQSWAQFHFTASTKASKLNNWSFHITPGITFGALEKSPQWLSFITLQNWSRFYLTWRREIRRPTLNDLYWPELGRGDLSAEVIQNWEALYRYESGKLQSRNFFLEFKLFHHRIQNAIRWLPENGQFRPRNFNRLISAGIKGTLTYEREKWLLGSFFQYARVRESGADRQLPYEPLLTAGGRLRFAAAKFSITYRLHYQNAVYTLAAADNQLPATWLHHLDLSHTFGAFELQLRLRNLSNLNYQRVAGYPLPGRHYRLQAIYDF